MRLHFPRRAPLWRHAVEILACWLLICAAAQLLEWGAR
jgi:hypothetical protein